MKRNAKNQKENQGGGNDQNADKPNALKISNTRSALSRKSKHGDDNGPNLFENPSYFET